MKRFAIPFAIPVALALAMVASLTAPAQIPKGFVQTTGTIISLANGKYQASWTNLSSSSQLPLLGGVSTFQQTVSGSLDGNGFFSVLLADTSQVTPSPSTWTFSFTYNCPPTNTGFMVQVAVVGGGGTQDISSQVIAALPSNPCSGGSGGQGTVNPGQLALAQYPKTSQTVVSPANFTYDAATGNNLNVPGIVTASSTVSGSVNGVYDLKAAFGASGSNQTMTCTATASSNTLTGCTGGDFKVGQWVTLPQFGISPTVFAPTGLAVSCGNDHIPTWSSTVTYAINQTVVASGVYYISLVANNLNNPPASSPSDWSSNATNCPPASTDTVTYTYEVVEVQGVPNGALSAPSSPVSITMSNPIQRGGISSSQPDIYASVSWTGDATNSSGYLVYRSVNGGPFNFYLHTDFHVFTIHDFNTFTPANMSCNDLQDPCTVPASGTPNDVYDVITAISGSTVTIATRTTPWQPVYTSSGGLSGAYPSTPSQSGRVTVYHDDTPAFELVKNALNGPTSSQQVKVHVPAGTYNLHSEAQFSGWGSAIPVGGLHNVIYEGDGDATYLNIANDRGLRFVKGMFEQCGNPNVTANHCTGWRMGNAQVGSTTSYTLQDPTPVGANVVYTATPSDSSNFSAGQYVTVHEITSAWSSSVTYPAGYLVTSGGVWYVSTQAANLNNSPPNATWWTPQGGNDYPWEYYGEINRVTKVDTAIGAIYLAYPLTKQYSANINVGPFSQCLGCSGVPTITPVLGTVESSDIIFRHFKIRAHVYQLFAFNSISDYMTVENNNIVISSLSGLGTSRHYFERNNTIIEDGYTQPTGIIEGAAADNDVEVKNNTFYGTHATGALQFCTEGTTNMVVSNNTIIETGAAEPTNGINAQSASIFQFLSLCFNTTVANNKVILSNTGQSYLNWWDTNVGGITENNNDIYIDSVSSNSTASIGILANAPSIPNPGVHIYGNKLRIGNSAQSAYSSSGGIGTTVSSGPTDAPMTTYTLTGVSGAFSYYRWAGQYTILSLVMSGNITAINFNGSSSRLIGNRFAIDFVQPGSGGPYTIPNTCADSGYATGGNGIDCPNGVPIAQTAANSHTILWFYDDGTTVHLIGTSYTTLPFLYSAAGTTIPTCNAANALLRVGVSDAPAGSLTPGTAYASGGGTIKVWEQCAYSGSAYAWQSE